MTATQNRSEHQGANYTPANSDGESDRSVRRPKLPRSRMGGVWVVLVVAALVLLLLLIFILQNGQRAEVSFLNAHGHLPMGVALLLAAIFGILVVALPGTARIIQLRMLNRGRARHSTVPRPIQPTPAATVPDPQAATRR